MKIAAILAFMLAGILTSIILDLPFVVIAVIILACLLAISIDRTIGGLFLLAICLHVMLSYSGVSIQGPTGISPANNAQPYVLPAFKIFVVGISCTLIGYAITSSVVIKRKPLDVDPTRLTRWALVAALIGSVIILYVVGKVGFVEMLLSGKFVRYFGEEQLGSGYAFYNSLLRRGLAISGAAAPILLLRWQQTRSRMVLVTAAGCLLTMAITTRRGYLAVSLLTFMLVSFLLLKNRKAIAVLLVALVLIFLAFQSLFAIVPTESSNPIIWTAVLASTLMADVNDFAFTLSEWNGRMYYGATWLAALWPFPAAISDFKDQNVLASVTKDIVGIPRDAESGGLRILVYGEAYLNGGYFGVIAVGLIFGFVLRRITSTLEWAKVGGPWLLLPFAFAFVLFCCQFYFSGSAVLSDAVLTALTLGAIYLISLKRPGLSSR